MKKQIKATEAVPRPGRKPPGFTINRDGGYLPDSLIVRTLQSYRSEAVFKSGGGYYKLTRYMAIEHGFYVNHKKVYRLCDENDLLLYSVDQRFKRPKRRAVGYVDVTGPNQLWQFDLKYGYIHGEQRHFFVLAMIDVFSKKVVGFFIGKSCRSGDLIFTLKQALQAESITVDHQLKIRSDNGPQMSSNQFHFYLAKLEQKLSHEFIPPRTPDRNAYIESFFSILENELLKESYFETFKDAYKAVCEFIEFYNMRRLHGAIGYQSPMRFIEQLKLGLINAISLKV